MLLRFGVVMAVNIMITVLLDAMSCKLVASHQYLRVTYRLQLQGTIVLQ